MYNLIMTMFDIETFLHDVHLTTINRIGLCNYQWRNYFCFCFGLDRQTLFYVLWIHYQRNCTLMTFQKSWLKIPLFFGCVLYIGTVDFWAFYTQLWGCILYTGACYTQNFMVCVLTAEFCSNQNITAVVIL